jgi:hypothetical protein
VARALGKGLAEFRRVTGEVNKELQTARDLIESEAREHETLRRARERAENAAAKAASVAAMAPGDSVEGAPSIPSADSVASAPPAPAAAHRDASAPAPVVESPPSETNDAAKPMPDAPAKA